MLFVGMGVMFLVVLIVLFVSFEVESLCVWIVDLIE